MLPSFWSHFYPPCNLALNLSENCHVDPPLQNSGLLSKYSSMTFNILAFITFSFFRKNIIKIKTSGWVDTEWPYKELNIIYIFAVLFSWRSITSMPVCGFCVFLERLEGIVLPKMKICWKFTPICRWVFLHQSRFGEIKHYITWSPMYPLQWMGAVRMRVQTADKNITIIHK